MGELAPGRTTRVGDLLDRAVREWVADLDSDVVYGEWLDGRLAVRMRQTVREATTVWWTPGDRSLRAEAYVIPAPPVTDAAHRLCLRRNLDTFRVWFAIDHEGAVVLRARVPVEEVDPSVLDQVLGEIYAQVELTFPPLVRTAFGGGAREKRP